MKRFENIIAVITGGGSGIGRAIATHFAAEGAKVHILDFNAEACREVVLEIEAAGGHVVVHTCDVSQQASVADVFAVIGKVNVLVNSAGVAHIGKAHNTSLADFERVYAVNVRGVYHCLHAAIPLMQQAGGGCIVNLCSIAAFCGLADRFAYSMSKGAVAAMTLSVAKDYLRDNIRCNSVSPARVHTPFVDGYLAKNYPGQEAEMFEELSKTQPIGRMGTPEEVAALVLFLCSKEAGFITGCDYPVDGGFLKLNT